MMMLDAAATSTYVLHQGIMALDLHILPTGPARPGQVSVNTATATANVDNPCPLSCPASTAIRMKGEGGKKSAIAIVMRGMFMVGVWHVSAPVTQQQKRRQTRKDRV